MAKPSTAKDRRFTVFRVHEEERELLRSLGPCDDIERYDVLLGLIDVLPDIELQPKKVRRPIRLGIPPELEEAIDKIARKTKKPFVEVLVAAARAWRAKHPAKK